MARYVFDSPVWFMLISWVLQGQLEMKKAIAESFDVMETDRASSSSRAVLGGKVREQRTALDELGLEESEALEYVLMLSRDEEEERQRQMLGTSVESASSIASSTSQSSSGHSAGIIERADSDASLSPRLSAQEDSPGDDEIFSMTPIPTPPSSPPLTAWSSRRSSNASSAHPRAMPITYNRKVQVTPPFRPEAIEAGTSPSMFSLDGSVPIPRKNSNNEFDFPAISASSSPNNAWSGSLPKPSRAPLSGSPAGLVTVANPAAASKSSSTSGSPPKPGRAWSSIVRSSGTPPRTSIPAARAETVTQYLPSMMPTSAEDEDEMLRLALEASLTQL